MPLQALGADYEMTDGERLPLAVKDLGSSDLYPQVSMGWWAACRSRRVFPRGPLHNLGFVLS